MICGGAGMSMENIIEVLETPDYMVMKAIGGVEIGRMHLIGSQKHPPLQEAQRCQQWIHAEGGLALSGPSTDTMLQTL